MSVIMVLTFEDNLFFFQIQIRLSRRDKKSPETRLRITFLYVMSFTLIAHFVAHDLLPCST